MVYRDRTNLYGRSDRSRTCLSLLPKQVGYRYPTLRFDSHEPVKVFTLNRIQLVKLLLSLLSFGYQPNKHAASESN